METFVSRDNLEGDIIFKCSLLGNYTSWANPSLARISAKLWKCSVYVQFWIVLACGFVFEISFLSIEFPSWLSLTTSAVLSACANT